MKCGTLFSGGEVAGEGMRAAGFEHVWGLEWDDAIAANARANGFNVITGDVMQADPHTFEKVEALHASPVCTNASQANAARRLEAEAAGTTKETELDRAAGRKVADFIDVLQPGIFTLENVYTYRAFDAFGYICAALTRGGYFWDFDHLNAADFGVPQTRKRLVLRAVRGRLLPHLPEPEPWQGWYQAVADLLPALPVSKFAPWQLARLPELFEDMGRGALIDSKNSGQEYGKLYRAAAEPALTVTADGRPSHRPRAFIVDGQNATIEHGNPTIRTETAPMFTVNSSAAKAPLRAFLMPGAGNTNFGEAEPGRGVRSADEPAHVVATNDGGGIAPRAWLVDSAGYPGADGVTKPVARASGEPANAVIANHARRPMRAWLDAGRVVSMTPRALARFQSLPDAHTLPDKASLATKIVGNGFPSLWVEKLYRGLRRG